MRGALLTVLSAGAFLQCLDSATLPPNPCPNLFQYQQDRNGGVFGRVMLDNDYSGYYDISVNMSIAAYLVGEQNLEIEMESTLDDILAGCPIVYNISFPIQGVIPRPTRIELNNKVYCTGPSEELRPGGVTDMWAAYYYRTDQPPTPLSAKPKQKLHPRCTLLKHKPPLHSSTAFSSEPWQQPSATPTTFALSHSSTWKPPVTGYNMNAPLTSSSTAVTTSDSFSSNALWQPSNPCPNLFQYQQDKHGDFFGRIMLDNDYSGQYDISVNMSFAAYLVGEQNLEIEMQSTLDDILAGCPIVYNISFPIQDVLPRITRIELNYKVYCTGPSEELGALVVTEMWAGHYYRTPLSAKPKQKLHPRCTLLKHKPPLHSSTAFSSEPWQQPSATPTTFALSHSSTWKPPVTGYNMNAPLTSSSTAVTTSDSFSSNALWQPSNPCPNLFQYQQDKHGDFFGRIMLDNDYSGQYDISVNMSFAAYLVGEQSLEIEMQSTLDDILAGCPIVYNISFPIQDVLPRITRIELNYKVYCTGPSEELGALVVTEMWAGHYYRTPLSAKPKQKLHPRCTLLKHKPPLHSSTAFSSEPWQQPSATPTTFALSHSSTWKPPVTGYNMNAPLTSSSTAVTTSDSFSSNALWQPSNPCPNLFQYQQDKHGDFFGRIMLDNDYSGQYDISVNMSFAAYLVGEQNLEIEMQSTLDDILAGCPIVYNISFPIQDVLPRITRIELNYKVYCTGPSEELGALVVTEMWAGHYYRTNQPPKPLSVQPEQKLHPRCTLLKQQPPLHSSTTPPSEPWQEPSATTTTAAPLSSNTLQPPLTATTTDAPLNSRPSSPWSWQSPSTASTTSAPMSSEPSMHSPKPVQLLPWLSRPSSVAASTVATLIEEFSLSGKECGLTVVNSRASVIDGDDFVDGEFPWLVAILYRRNLDWDYRCTGSLVSNRHVITAGHCVKRKKEIANFLLIFGTKNLPAPSAVQRELQNVSVHPDYTDNKDDANVAILTVKKQIEFGAAINPVCLWHGEEYVNRMAGMQGTVVGWWRDGKRKFIDAKKIDLPIVSQTECLNSFSSMSSVISPRTFCAGLRGVGPCHGDSGAGFAMQRNGRWTLRGVVFTAVGDLDRCNDDIDNYFVFVDVDKVMSWLKKVMT